MGLLSHDEILNLHAAVVSVRLVESRLVLLTGIDDHFRAGLPQAPNPRDQMLSDIDALSAAGALADGTVPLATWLVNAVRLVGPRAEGQVFEAALERCKLTVAKPVARPGYQARHTPLYPDAATRVIGEQIEAARIRKRALETVGADTMVVDGEILDLRRRLREGGQLRAGDSLANGRYLLLERVGRGGFAFVWKAEDRESEAIVAIKVLHANLAGDPIRCERFFRGARAMAGLDHAAVVKVLVPEAEDGGFYYFVMEYVEGEDLHRAVINGRMPKDEVFSVIFRAGSALSLVHDQGFVHRDIKPANILLDRTRAPHLTDFDLVGGANTTGGTRTGALGTFLYAAPESLDKPQDADARADVYGLAMTAVFGLHGAELPKTILRNADVVIDGLSCTAGVKEVLKRAVDWDKETRFANARIFCAALRRAYENPTQGLHESSVRFKHSVPVRAPRLPVSWNVALARNPNFTGREREIERLREALVEGQPNAAVQVVSGLGGVGKTQLALEYSYRYAGEYDVVWWLRAEEPATLAADFADLAHELQLPGRTEPDQRFAIEAVKRWLAQNRRWLLVFDSVREPRDVAPYLSLAGAGHAIVTSRNAPWRRVANLQPVPELDRDDSIAFFLKRTGQSDAVAAQDLAEALGDLPLALEQAGAYIEETGVPIHDYLSLFNARQRELLARSASRDAASAVATTWDLAFHEVRARSPVAADLLTLAAFLAPEDIPRAGLRKGAAHLPSGLAAATADPLALDDAVAALLRYSLIEAHQETLSVHRLVQAVVRERLNGPERAVWAERAVWLVDAVFPTEIDDDRTAWPVCARWLPHARAATGHAEDAKAARKATVAVLGKAGKYLHLRKAFGEARELYGRALPLAEDVYGPEHVGVANILNGLGHTLKELGDLKGALAHAERALCIDERRGDPARVAQDANQLAGMLYLMGDRLEEARALAERALEIDKREHGEDDATIARDANTLAAILWRLRDLEGARANAERALAIDQKHLPPDDPELCKRHNNLGFLLREMGDREGARRHLEHALAMGEAVYGPDDASVATFHSNLAAVLEELGEGLSARAHHERAIEIGEATFGPDHYAVAVRRNNLGLLLKAMGDLQGAIEQLELAVTIGRKALGPEHRRVKKFEANLAAIRRITAPSSR